MTAGLQSLFTDAFVAADAEPVMWQLRQMPLCLSYPPCLPFTQRKGEKRLPWMFPSDSVSLSLYTCRCTAAPPVWVAPGTERTEMVGKSAHLIRVNPR